MIAIVRNDIWKTGEVYWIDNGCNAGQRTFVILGLARQTGSRSARVRSFEDMSLPREM